MTLANSNIHTKLVPYLVWREGEKGVTVMAMSAYDARRRRAKELRLAGVTTLSAKLKSAE